MYGHRDRTFIFKMLQPGLLGMKGLSLGHKMIEGAPTLDIPCSKGYKSQILTSNDKLSSR